MKFEIGDVIYLNGNIKRICKIENIFYNEQLYRLRNKRKLIHHSMIYVNKNSIKVPKIIRILHNEI